MAYTNRLAQETSPYLLQHAHNPVDWYPWGDEALSKARSEDKPILVSIGYAACHWCHVMERESFEDEGTARFMNEHFINIKIDREERPDLDHIYMDAVQAITGSGGWPLNVFLTPEGRPFYGGTYFPPRPIHNRSSWKELLSAIIRSYREKRAEIEEQASHLTRHIAGSSASLLSEAVQSPIAGARAGKEWPVGMGPSDLFKPETLGKIRDTLMANADRQWGGFGAAPKFPQTFSIQYLLRHYHFTRDQEALDQACLSLDRMLEGGIYDQLGGGFARYSTDTEWLAPHFEKMLYDNALLVIVLSEAYQLTGLERYRQAIDETMLFVKRELSWTSPEGELAFYSALDADSEGEEGKYYVWDKSEIEGLLGADAALFCRCYGVTERGNWEGKNILVRKEALNGLNERERETLDRSKEKLLARRETRIRPALDDKILLGWNALMNLACSKAFAALGNDLYREWAISNMRFCAAYLTRNGQGEGDDLYFYYHSYKAGQAKFPAFLDDYSSLAAALIQLQEITGNGNYLLDAKRIVEFVSRNFSDEEQRLFYFTHREQPDLIVRKREIYDGAVPSGNGQMAGNLLYLSVVFDEPAWEDRAMEMTLALRRPTVAYPGSFGTWATLYQAFTYVIPEIVITGRQPDPTRKEFLKYMVPYRVFQSTAEENQTFPLLSGKQSEGSPLIFLCENYSCQLPVNEVVTLMSSLENVQKFRG